MDTQASHRNHVLHRYPGRIPVVMHRHTSCRPGVKLDKCRFIVPSDLTFSQFAYILRKRLTLCPSEALFFFSDQKALLNQSETIGMLHDKYQDDEHHLNVTYTTENCFG